MSDVHEEPFAAPIDVQVKWCGMNYDVRINPGDNIGGLKRKTCELTGLPSKRQRHLDVKGKEFNDEYTLVSLQDPPSTDLISLNKKVDAETYRTHFRADKPTCTVEDTKVRLEDFGNLKTRLRKGKYNVGSMAIDCLIKYHTTQVVRSDLVRSIELMRAWKHSKLVVIENVFNEEGSRIQRLVLSNTVGGTLNGYIKSELKDNNDVISNTDGTFTDFFKTMILDLCVVLDEMVKRKLCPINISRENLYLKRMDNADPELKVLFDNVDHLNQFSGKGTLTTLCQELKAICSPNEHKHVGTEAFCNFLGKEAMMFLREHNLAKTARHYPINWTYDQKSQYLIDLIPSTPEVRKSINECGIVWPTDVNGNLRGTLLELKIIVDEENEKIRNEKQPFLDEIGRLTELGEKISSEEQDQEIREASLQAIQDDIAENQKSADKVRKEISWNYDMQYAYDLVRLARNHWKHFETFPWSLKEYYRNNKNTILDALESWCPGVWVLMYNALGLG